MPPLESPRLENEMTCELTFTDRCFEKSNSHCANNYSYSQWPQWAKSMSIISFWYSRKLIAWKVPPLSVMSNGQNTLVYHICRVKAFNIAQSQIKYLWHYMVTVHLQAITNNEIIKQSKVHKQIILVLCCSNYVQLYMYIHKNLYIYYVYMYMCGELCDSAFINANVNILSWVTVPVSSIIPPLSPLCSHLSI